MEREGGTGCTYCGAPHSRSCMHAVMWYRLQGAAACGAAVELGVKSAVAQTWRAW